MGTCRVSHHIFSPNSASPLFGDFVFGTECNKLLNRAKEKRPHELLIREDALYNIKVI